MGAASAMGVANPPTPGGDAQTARSFLVGLHVDEGPKV